MPRKISRTVLSIHTDDITDIISMVLSAIQIASLWCPPIFQRLIKAICFTQHNNYIKNQRGYTKHRRLRLLLFPLLFFRCTPSVHAIPGTNHAIIKGQASSDITCQHKYIIILINKLNDDTAPVATSSTTLNANKISTKSIAIIDRPP